MYRAIAICLVLGVASQSWAEARVESNIKIPYERLQAVAQNSVDFEAHSEWATTPNALSRTLKERNVGFAATFAGQTVVAQRTDTAASNPLALSPLTPFTDADKLAAFNEPDGFRTLQNYSRRSAYLPLIIGGRGRRTANMLTGHQTARQNKVLTSLSPRLQLDRNGGWTDNSALGIEPISLMFDEDQTAVGFSLVALKRRSQEPFVAATMYESLVQIKFFRRDGSLISEIVMPLNQTERVAFARCGQTVDIAGVQISNSTLTGIALDDLIFGVPAVEGHTDDNPLQVELCTFFTS